MSFKKSLFRVVEGVAFIGSALVLCGCTVTIGSLDQASTATIGEHLVTTVRVSENGLNDGGTHYGNMAVLLPTGWSIDAMVRDGTAMSQDQDPPVDPSVAPEGYAWSFWRTEVVDEATYIKIDETVGTKIGRAHV